MASLQTASRQVPSDRRVTNISRRQDYGNTADDEVIGMKDTVAVSPAAALYRDKLIARYDETRQAHSPRLMPKRIRHAADGRTESRFPVLVTAKHEAYSYESPLCLSAGAHTVSSEIMESYSRAYHGEILCISVFRAGEPFFTDCCRNTGKQICMFSVIDINIPST